jgi:hypothetical protein
MSAPRDARREEHRAGTFSALATAKGTPLTSLRPRISKPLQQLCETVFTVGPLSPEGSSDVAEPEPLALGEVLGKGGVGVVYAAEQLELRRGIATKALDLKRASREAGHRFLQEAWVTASLSHPNIVPVHILTRGPGGALLLGMKRVRGETWRARRERQAKAGALDIAAELEALLAVCDAIDYAHSRGVVHLDLKTENVMIGAFGEVLVLDWGLAHRFGPRGPEAPSAPHVEDLRDPCGTPRYMAPELAAGEGVKIDARTDVYLLGAILYELLSGAPPHDGSTLLEVVKAALFDVPEPLPDDSDPELVEVCNRALAREPEARFQSVGDLSSALRRAQRHARSRELARSAAQSLAAASIESQRALGSEDRWRREGLLSDAIVGFREAQTLWAENASAREGERSARAALTSIALRADDLALGRAQLERLTELGPLPEGLAAERERAEARARRREVSLTVQRAIALLALLALAGAGWSLLEARRALDQARQSRSTDQALRLDMGFRSDRIMFLPKWLPQAPPEAFEAKKDLDALVLTGQEIRAQPTEFGRGERWSLSPKRGVVSDPLRAWFESARATAATRAQHAQAFDQLHLSLAERPSQRLRDELSLQRQILARLDQLDELLGVLRPLAPRQR